MKFSHFFLKYSAKSTLSLFIAVLLVFSSCAQAEAQKESASTQLKEEKPQLSQAERSLLTRQYTDMIRSVFMFVEQNYVDEVDPTVLYEGAMKGMLDSLGDQYTVYLDKSQMRDLNDTTTGNFGGVGLSITKPNVSTPEKPAYVEVASPIEGTPGWRAGIQAGDLIISIDDTNTADITMEEVLSKLRGTPNTDVKVVIRRGKNMEFPVVLTRAIIEVPSVKWCMIDDIGYLRITEFAANTPERVQQALNSFEECNYKSMIIDLRSNPGGLINSVVEVADKFISSGTIVSTKSRIQSENRVFSAKSNSTCVPKNMPVIVLINRGSASASEILSGALKDYHLAYLVGEKTYGKGLVQQVIPLNLNDDGFKFTTSRYYTPSGANINKIGIPPDREVLYPVLSEDEEKAYIDLLNSGEIEKYAEDHPDMTLADAEAFAKTLGKTYKLEDRVLRKLVRNQYYRKHTEPLYDLDYDIQLNEAIRIIRKENFNSLMKKTKTIIELQAEAEKKAAAEEKTSKN